MLRSLNSRHCRLFLVFSLLANVVLVIYLLQLYHGPAACLQEMAEEHSNLRTVKSVGVEQKRAGGESNVTYQNLEGVIFVGGVPRSGTTLARAMLDAHPEVRCGEETRVIPRIISMRNRWNKAEREHQRLIAAGLTDQTLDQATRAFVAEIILNHGKPAKHLCNKDPLVLNYMHDIIRLFPKSRFILMLRDGRAVAYSIVSRNITISGVDSKNFMSAALFWNKVTERMLRDCKAIDQRCFGVPYEKLVSSPKEWMSKILDFLHIPWSDNVLHHEAFINSEVSLSKMEPSSNQVKEAVHTNAIEKWREKMPRDMQKEIYKECHMLKQLGYPP